MSCIHRSRFYGKLDQTELREPAIRRVYYESRYLIICLAFHMASM